MRGRQLVTASYSIKNIFIKRKNQKVNNISLDINIVTCSFAAYLKSSYGNELDELLKTYDENKQNFVDRKVNEKIFNNKKLLDDGNNNNIEKLFIKAINSNIIDKQYKKYFYNFPKGTKIYTTTEKYVSDIISNDIIINNENIKEVKNNFSAIDDIEFIKDKISSIIKLGKEFPNVVMYEKQSFNVAYEINVDKLKEKYDNELNLENNNIDDICKKISLLSQSNIDKPKLAKIISDTINGNFTLENIDEETVYKLRKPLIETFGENILYFKEIFKGVEIEEEEIVNVNDINTLISISQLVTHNDDVDNWIANKFNSLTFDNKLEYLLKIIKTMINYKFIFKINLDSLSNDGKGILYRKIIEKFKDISDNDKLLLLNYLKYVNSEIANEFLNKMGIDYDSLIDYLNIQEKCTDECLKFINESEKLYNISNIIYDSLDKTSEKYYAYYIYKNKTIPVDLLINKKMYCDIFLKYSQLTSYFTDNNGALKELKVYNKFNLINVTKEKIIIISKLDQTKDMIKSIIENEYISDELKAIYLKNTKLYNQKTIEYLIDYIKTGLNSKTIANAILSNRRNLYFNLKDANKIKKPVYTILSSIE